MAKISSIRTEVGDRALLRSIHFFEENYRVSQAADYLRKGDFAKFLEKINQSGNSSWSYLQNISPTGATKHQEMGLAIALAKQALNGEGAVRVHGGGFAGTVQAFVPLTELDQFKTFIEKVLGENSCHLVKIRSIGGFVLEQPE